MVCCGAESVGQMRTNYGRLLRREACQEHSTAAVPRQAAQWSKWHTLPWNSVKLVLRLFAFVAHMWLFIPVWAKEETPFVCKVKREPKRTNTKIRYTTFFAVFTHRLHSDGSSMSQRHSLPLITIKHVTGLARLLRPLSRILKSEVKKIKLRTYWASEKSDR